VHKLLAGYGLFETIDREHVYLSIDEAIADIAGEGGADGSSSAR
jgi:hypothetical protein